MSSRRLPEEFAATTGYCGVRRRAKGRPWSPPPSLTTIILVFIYFGSFSSTLCVEFMRKAWGSNGIFKRKITSSLHKNNRNTSADGRRNVKMKCVRTVHVNPRWLYVSTAILTTSYPKRLISPEFSYSTSYNLKFNGNKPLFWQF